MFVGRKYELGIIRDYIASNRPELGIVYGRRRVGKRRLLEQAPNTRNKLFFEGIKGATLKKQIEYFTYQLAKNTNRSQIVAYNWHDAFNELTRYIGKKRIYIVFDEFPWMASGKTELVSLLKYYWDNHWKKNPKLTLVLCGSIASFMVDHIVHSEALHNRKTFEIKLERADFVKVFRPVSLNGATGRRTPKVVLWDEWLRFYFTYVKPNIKTIDINTTPGLFEKIAGNSLSNYLGLSFERLCMKNLPAIFRHIGYDIHTIKDFGPFFRQRQRNPSKDQGVQIDILVHRTAKTLMLIECKFTSSPIGSSIIKEIERKVRFLKPPKNYTIEKVLVSCSGVTHQLESEDYFHHILGVEAFF